MIRNYGDLPIDRGQSVNVTTINQSGSAAAVTHDSDTLTQTIDRIVICLLAVCPILQHYMGPFVNAAVSVLLIVFPYAVLKLLKKNIRVRELKIVFPLIVYHLYQIIDHGTSITEIGKVVLFIVYVIVIANACFDTAFFVKVITFVAAAACICIVLQYFCYYILGFHLQMVPTSLLLPRSQQWVLLAQTGRYSVTQKLIKFYRPSAFFLEPSHMFIYMFTPTTIRVLSARTVRQKMLSLLLLGGMVLTTSGMGILCAAALFALYLGKTRRNNKTFSLKRFFRPANLILMACLIVVFIAAYYKVPFLRNSIERVFSSGSDYGNAVSGRLDSGWKLLQNIHGIQWVFGVSESLSGITANLSGFIEALYQYGIIGVILSYLFYLRGLKLKNEFFWVTIIILAVSFFSQHTHSTMFLIYAVFVFFEGDRREQLMAGDAAGRTDAPGNQ